jgi:hypothetical protein
MHICISYPLPYLNKYALTTNVFAYVKYANTFACQNYLRKIVVVPLNTIHIILFCYTVFQQPATDQSIRYVDLPKDHMVTNFTQPDPQILL